MSEQEKSTKTPQTVDAIIESFSNQIRKAYQLMISDEFDTCYGAANKVVKQVLKKIQTLFAQKRFQEKILSCLLKCGLQR